MSNMSRGGMNMPGMNMPSGGGMDLNDVTYDAFLANDRTLADPQVFEVEKGAEVRLRIINAAASTNFMIELGNVEGTVLTVDGNPVVPLKVRQFPLAVAQRVDIAVRLPADGSALPVLARGEGLAMQTGVVLRPRGAAVAKIRRDGGDGRTGARPDGRDEAARRRNRCRRGGSTGRCRSIWSAT